MSINLDKASKINPFAGHKSSKLRSSITRAIKHLPGEHDQLTHGHGDGVNNSQSPQPNTSSVAPKPKSLGSQLQGLSIQERKAMWQAMSQEQQDELVNAKEYIKNTIATRLKFAGRRPTEGEPVKAVNQRLKQIGDFITPDAGKQIQKHMKALDGFLKASKVDDDSIREILLESVDALAVQENESLSRSLGDHGVRHLLGDVDAALSILETVPGFDSPQTKAVVTLAGVFHDSGYLTEPSHFFLDSEHPHHSTQHYEANISPMIKDALGDAADALLKKTIETHYSNELDWENDPVASAFRVADNVALFHKEKLPGLIHHVPENKQVIFDFADKKIDVPEAIKRMKANIKSSSLSDSVKAVLSHAADEFSPVLVKNTLGMLAGEIKGFDWQDNSLVVKVKRDQENLKMHQVFDLGQKNFTKFAEAFGVDPKKFETENKFEFIDPQTSKLDMLVLVEGKLEKELFARIMKSMNSYLRKHHAGEHDQLTHGNWSDATWKSLESESQDKIINTMKHAKPVKVFGSNLANVYTLDLNGDRRVVEWDGEDDLYPAVSPIDDFVYSSSGERMINKIVSKLSEQFSSDFNQHPQTLYHATDSKNVASITSQGLKPSDKTRGITNRHVHNAIFTTLNENSALSGSYGDSVFKIDTQAMKRDGIDLSVEKEPEAFRQEATQILANAIGIEDFESNESFDNADDPETVIAYNSIPPKYLTLVTQKSQGDNAILYHGTGADVVERIKKEGLLPPSLTGNAVAMAHSIESEEDADRYASVYLTGNKKKTLAYALQSAKFHNASQAAIIEVELPESESTIIDEYDSESVRLPEVKPEWIKNISLLSVGDLERMTKSARDRETLYAVVVIK